MKHHIITAMFLAFVLPVIGQTFQQTYKDIHAFYSPFEPYHTGSVRQTTDGGYILSSGQISATFMLIKTDAAGDTTWTKQWVLPNNWNSSFTTCARQTADGGYVLLGNHSGFTSGTSDITLIKTDAVGNQQWMKHSYNSNQYAYTDGYGYAVEQTSDLGYIIAGTKGGVSSKAFLIKTNFLGDTLWTRSFGGTYFDIGYSVQQTTDGGYIMTGLGQSFGDTVGDVLLVKTDASGNILFQKSFGGPGIDFGSTVKQTADGGYIISGYTNSFGNPYFGSHYIVKTDANGDTLWTKAYGEVSDYGMYYSLTSQALLTSYVTELPSGNYIMAGTGRNPDSFLSNIFLYRLNSSGDTIWTRMHGRLYNEIIASDIIVANDGGIVVSGAVDGYAAILLKADSAGVYDCSVNSCVWPGDANNDMVANNLDLLYVALGYDSTGSWRYDPDYTYMSWLPHYGQDWNLSFGNGENYKHADADGDGIISFMDTFAIWYNYGQIHLFSAPNEQQRIASLPDLYIDYPSLTAAAGNFISIPIKLGSASLPASSVYGVAFTVMYDTAFTDFSVPPSVTYSSSWLGNSNNLLYISKDFNQGLIDVGIARNDHQVVTGNGTIATLTLKIKSGANGWFHLAPGNITVIDNLGNVIGVNAVADSIQITPTGIEESIADHSMLVYPNPGNGHFTIKSNELLEQIEVYSLTGQLLYASTDIINDRTRAVIDLTFLSKGIYWLKVTSEKETVLKKLAIQ